LSPTPHPFLPVLQQQVRTLARLVDDLFELARIDAGALTLELREAQLAGLVESCLRGLEAEARARRVTLEARVDEDAIAWCAPDQVERVLLNLITNALRHTPSDGSIAVRVEPHPRGLQVTVEDTGEGLGAEAQRRMFERFWRGDQARTSGSAGAGLGLGVAGGRGGDGAPGEGSGAQAQRRMFERFWRGDQARTSGSAGAGLGLAIARGLVEAQGGQIWAEPRSGGGARVCFTLPRDSLLRPACGGRACPSASPRRMGSRPTGQARAAGA